MALGTKTVPFELRETKAAGKSRQFEGYASTWTKDLGGDTIHPGAFKETLETRLPKRRIKVRWLHFDPMGVMIDGKEDDNGLFVVGEVPETPTNIERLQLMEAGVVDKLSIGYDTFPEFTEISEDGWSRDLYKVELFEFSPVDLPMNEDTELLAVKELFARLPLQVKQALPDLSKLTPPAPQTKSATAFADLPLGPLDYPFVEAEARERVLAFLDSADSTDFAQAFVFYNDSEDAENPSSYDLLIADIIDDVLSAVPGAIMTVADTVNSDEFAGGLANQDDLQPLKDHIDRYFEKMTSEFGQEFVSPWTEIDPEDGLEDALEEELANSTFITASRVANAVKAGKVLSSANRTLIEQARDALASVLVADSGSDDAKMWEEAGFKAFFDELETSLRV